MLKVVYGDATPRDCYDTPLSFTLPLMLLMNAAYHLFVIGCREFC